MPGSSPARRGAAPGRPPALGARGRGKGTCQARAGR